MYDGTGDRDGDGMPDDWERSNGLNPDVNDANLDGDADGATNWEEYVAGTHPGDPTSLLQLTLSVFEGETTAQFIAVAGKTYTVHDPGFFACRELAQTRRR